jgi:hypothetical protein
MRVVFVAVEVTDFMLRARPFGQKLSSHQSVDGQAHPAAVNSQPHRGVAIGVRGLLHLPAAVSSPIAY